MPNGEDRVLIEKLRLVGMRLSGMRASVTGMVAFSMRLAPAHVLGAEGGYLREPVFSTEAWRNAAGALGGVIALAKLLSSRDGLAWLGLGGVTH